MTCPTATGTTAAPCYRHNRPKVNSGFGPSSRASRKARRIVAMPSRLLDLISLLGRTLFERFLRIPSHAADAHFEKKISEIHK